ncbi:MAG: hypothetical protein IPP64_05365 [Bacteroidetes bacterium]|nr:hypothetical protein [Bacteroidota bacterium]
MIKKQKNKRLLFFVYLLIPFQIVSAQIVSPFNKQVLSDSSENYSFIVSGHFHGQSNSRSTFPASTILAGIDTLNSLHPLFLMSLGDVFLDVNDTYFNHYHTSLFAKLKMPLFNAVGNHDLSNGNIYEKVYGKTFFTFTVHSELYVVLNTEIADGSIKDEQLVLLKKALADAKSDKIKNIFIFSHRPIWSENNAVYEHLFKGNTRTALGSNNYESELKPILKDLSKSKSVFWLSGSMADAPVSFFYQKDDETGIVYIQTAIRDLPRDAVLQVKVESGKVELKGISLTGQTLEPIEKYNLEYWKNSNSPEESFSLRLLPYLFKKIILHTYFWIGFISSLALIFLFRLVIQWRRRK